MEVLKGLTIAAICAYSAIASAKSEADHNWEWCGKLGGIIEYRLEDKTRVDCLTDDYAIEMDWGRKWAEGLGQALYYAAMTDRQAGVVLIIKRGEQRYIDRINKAIAANKLKVKVWVKWIE